LAAVLALTGCGGGKDDDEAALTTTTPPTTAAPATTAAPLVGNDQAGTPFCQLARTYTERYSTLLGAAGDPVKLRAASTDVESAVRQAQAAAPAEIKADVTAVATTASQVLAALKNNDFDVARTPEVAKLQEPGFRSSLANLNRYTRAHCGLG
jgi:polyisoprenoid-binding protein YceI